MPRHYISEFTVRDKGRDKDGIPRDIGEFAKSQIIGKFFIFFFLLKKVFFNIEIKKKRIFTIK